MTTVKHKIVNPRIVLFDSHPVIISIKLHSQRLLWVI